MARRRCPRPHGERGDSTASPRRRRSMMGRHPGCVVLALLILLLLPLTAGALPLSTADLSDDWRVTYVAVPTGPFTASAIRAYKGDVAFDAAGVASGTLVADEFTAGALTFTVGGSLALSAQ